MPIPVSVTRKCDHVAGRIDRRLVLCLNGENPSSRHGIAGVGGQVEEDALELTGVHQDRPGARNDAGDKVDGAPNRASQKRCDLPDDFFHVERSELARWSVGHVEQLACQVGSPLGGQLDRLDVLLDTLPMGQVSRIRRDGLRRHGVGHELGIRRDDGHDVVEVVDDSADELVNTLEPTSPVELHVTLLALQEERLPCHSRRL